MYAATVNVHPPPGATAAAKDRFRSRLQEQALDHPVEHLHLRDGPGGLQVTLFARTATQHEADLLVYHLCARVIHQLPGWQLDT